MIAPVVACKLTDGRYVNVFLDGGDNEDKHAPSTDSDED